MPGDVTLCGPANAIPLPPGNSSWGICLNTFSPRDQKFPMTYIQYKSSSFVRRLFLLNTIQVDTYRDIQRLSDSSFDKYRLRISVAQKRLTLFGREITKNYQSLLGNTSTIMYVHVQTCTYCKSTRSTCIIHRLSVEQVLLLPLLSYIAGMVLCCPFGTST